MKKITFISLLLVALGSNLIYSQNYYSNFPEGSVTRLIGDKVNIRSKPHIKGSVVDQLPVGQEVTIIGESEEVYEKDGYSARWYQVSYKVKGKLKKGFVWGGLIASNFVSSPVDPELIFMYAPAKVEKGEYFDKVSLKIKLLKKDQLLAETIVDGIGQLSAWTEVNASENKGVKGITNIFEIHSSAGYCGGDNGTIYFFFDGTKLQNVLTLHSGFDAPYFYNNDLIFPTDSLGIKGKILNYAEGGYYPDDSDDPIIEEWEKITYNWNGSELVVEKEEKWVLPLEDN